MHFSSLVSLPPYLHMIGDLSRASAKIKSEVPGRTKEAEKEGEKWAAQAGAKVDAAVSIPSFF